MNRATTRGVPPRRSPNCRVARRPAAPRLRSGTARTRRRPHHSSGVREPSSTSRASCRSCVKILAAGTPLSLQAHPSTEQAQEGFARENAAGIPIDAPHRNYKDPYSKPEMIYALSDEFRALCGFRPVAETRAVLSAGGVGHLLPELRSDADIRPVFEWLLSDDPTVAAVVAEVSAASVDAPGDSWQTVRGLVEHFAGDPGIAISLLLHTVVLRRGEALYLPSGNIHAYQEGLAIEVMGASDNVLRGGLTPKHVDVARAARRCSTSAPCPLPGSTPTVTDGSQSFLPAGSGFRLRVLEAGASVAVESPAIVVATGAGFEIDGIQVRPGRAIAVVDGIERDRRRGAGRRRGTRRGLARG